MRSGRRLKRCSGPVKALPDSRGSCSCSRANNRCSRWICAVGLSAFVGDTKTDWVGIMNYAAIYVTPILMGASQLWQQKMTPAAGDPVQQKMMMMMPLVFTFMFLWMPSGLTVYWFFSNLLAIGQQYITNSLVGPPNAPRATPTPRTHRARASRARVHRPTRRRSPTSACSMIVV